MTLKWYTGVSTHTSRCPCNRRNTTENRPRVVQFPTPPGLDRGLYDSSISCSISSSLMTTCRSSVEIGVKTANLPGRFPERKKAVSPIYYCGSMDEGCHRAAMNTEEFNKKSQVHAPHRKEQQHRSRCDCCARTSAQNTHLRAKVARTQTRQKDARKKKIGDKYSGTWNRARCRRFRKPNPNRA